MHFDYCLIDDIRWQVVMMADLFFTLPAMAAGRWQGMPPGRSGQAINCLKKLKQGILMYWKTIKYSKTMIVRRGQKYIFLFGHQIFGRICKILEFP